MWTKHTHKPTNILFCLSCNLKTKEYTNLSNWLKCLNWVGLVGSLALLGCTYWEYVKTVMGLLLASEKMNERKMSWNWRRKVIGFRRKFSLLTCQEGIQIDSFRANITIWLSWGQTALRSWNKLESSISKRENFQVL